jgi:isocitrate dehydrogenase kinase/phosphatase
VQTVIKTEKLDLPKIVPEEEELGGNPWLDAASYVDLVHEDFTYYLEMDTETVDYFEDAILWNLYREWWDENKQDWSCVNWGKELKTP